MASEPTLSSLAQLAASASSNDVLSAPLESTSATTKTKEQLRRHYIRTLHKVVDESDVIVLVLDARDPAGCRSRLVEEEVRRREAEGKRLVFVLNKIGTSRISLIHVLRLSGHRHCMGRHARACRFGAPRECPGMAQTPPPHNTNAPIPLRGLTSAHEPRV
jgi:nuclear GTP-binding protein